MKRLPPAVVLTIGLLAAIALVASVAALLHHPTPRTVIERTVIHDTPSTVVVTLPGGERVVIERIPGQAPRVVSTTTRTTTTAASGSGSTTPPSTTTTACPTITAPRVGCVTAPAH